jgi:tRNA threonylcarbamoyladenosine modification (KEOPS) complex Cgi121 subunit
MAMETLLYTAAQHQIQKAIQTIGLKPDTTNIAVTILAKKPQQIKSTLADLSDNLQTTPCETVLDLTQTKINQIKQTFNITNQMIETITKNKETNTTLVDLVIEKIALMATKI